MVPLPSEIIENIYDFTSGTNNYWRHKFNTVINEINNLKFFVFTEYSNRYCNICRYNDTEFTIESDYDEALRLYYSYVHKLFSCSCGCLLKDCRILPVSDDYYDALSYNDIINDHYNAMNNYGFHYNIYSDNYNITYYDEYYNYYYN